MDANDRQHGGDHYKGSAYQHWDWVSDLKMLYLPGNASKYAFRWRKKNGMEDLEKCIHYLDKTMEEKVNILPVMNRHDLFWRFAIANNIQVMDGALLFYIMEGEWEAAKAIAAQLLALASASVEAS